MRDLIYPLCIYSSVGYKSFVGLPQLNAQGEYECIDEFTLYDKDLEVTMKKEGMIYVVSGYVKPIPKDMQMYCISTSLSRPYITTGFEIFYDVFERDIAYQDIECITFLAYSTPKPNTVPLYVWSNGEEVFISLDPTKPQGDNWTAPPGGSPIFVMTQKDVTFTCVNNSCDPNGETSYNGVYGVQNNRGGTLDECLVSCEIFGDNCHISPPPTYLEENFSQQDVSAQQDVPVQDKHPNCRKVVYSFLCCISLVILIYCLYN